MASSISSMLRCLALAMQIVSALERAGMRTALPSVGTDPVFQGSQARYVVTVEAAGARCAVPADFDADGDMDLVSVSSNDNTVAWYERLNDGSYGPKNMISKASNGARIVTVGDIDQDNKTDVVVASYYDHTVGWFKNIGGSFGDMHMITRGAKSAQGVSVADLDNDGDLDVLVASSGDNTISWYENLGLDGKFCEVKHVIDTEAMGIRTVIAADLDEDGYLDLAAASKDDGTIAWYRNDKHNQFKKIVVDDKARGAYSLVASDVDKDGHMDLVAAANAEGEKHELEANGEGGKVSFYRNARRTDGQLCDFKKVPVTAGNASGENDFDWFVLSVWAGDLDMDGDVDIASASFGLLHQGGISWYENVDGHGNDWFRHQIYITPGVKTGHYVFGADMDGDGDNDLVATTNGDNTVQILTASTRCDNSTVSPKSECCTSNQYWNGSYCVTCALGTYPRHQTCSVCSHECPRKGLAFHPTTCHSVKGCGNIESAFSRCDCGQDKYRDDLTGTCVNCPDGHITLGDRARAIADHVLVKRSFLDGTSYSISDFSWYGFNETRCKIPSCGPGHYFDMSGKRCMTCGMSTYSVGGSVTSCHPCPAGYQCSAGTSVPEACAKGYFSEERSLCTPCDAGKYADVMGASRCKNCSKGEYRDTAAGESCNFCLVGSYMNYTGSTACALCDDILVGSTTRLMRAIEASSCVCGVDAWRGESNDRCTPCPLGVDCSRGDTSREVAPGYYAQDSDFTPFKGVWKCQLAELCPGGPVESCAKGRVGIACATCPDGMHAGGLDDCEPCTDGKSALAWLLFIVLVLACIIAYYTLNSPITAKASAMLTTSCLFGMMLSMLQSFGIFAMLDIPWPRDVLALLELCNIVMLDFDVVSLECAHGTGASRLKYLSSVLFFPMTEIIIILCFVASPLLPKRLRWEKAKTLNIMGQFLQVGFTTMASIALVPMMCYSHPNDKKSVVKFPQTVCGSEEHDGMMVGSAFLLCGAVAFYVFALILAWVTPRMVLKRNVQFLQSARFLFFRFRVDAYYWGCVLMLRSLALSLVPALATDEPRVQMIVVTFILMVAAAFQIFFWPWKVPLLNVLDAAICIILMMAVITASAFMESEVGDKRAFYNIMLVSFTVSLYILCGCMLVMALVAVFFRGAMGSTSDLFQLRKVPDLDTLAEKLHSSMKSLCDGAVQDVSEMLNNLAVYDIWLLERITAIISPQAAASQIVRRTSLSNLGNRDADRPEAKVPPESHQATKTCKVQTKPKPVSRRVSLSNVDTDWEDKGSPCSSVAGDVASDTGDLEHEDGLPRLLEQARNRSQVKETAV